MNGRRFGEHDKKMPNGKEGKEISPPLLLSYSPAARISSVVCSGLYLELCLGGACYLCYVSSCISAWYADKIFVVGVVVVQVAVAVLNDGLRPDIPSWCPEEFTSLIKVSFPFITDYILSITHTSLHTTIAILLFIGIVLIEVYAVWGL